jgi:DNA-binding transcriptional MerR regulator
MTESERLYYSISEVCQMTGLKPHVLRYWETAFPMLKPGKNQAGNRIYRPRDVQLIKLIKKLLYDERFTVDGARQKLEEMKNGTSQMELELENKTSSSGVLTELCKELQDIIRILGSDPMAVDDSESTV